MSAYGRTKALVGRRVDSDGRNCSESDSASAQLTRISPEQAAAGPIRPLSNATGLPSNSPSPLLLQDLNANQNVYQHEPVGTATDNKTTATTSSQTLSSTPTPSPTAGLISHASSTQQPAFLDASNPRGDVFSIPAKLTAKDIDSHHDLYDAHVCTSTSPCIPGQAVEPPPQSTKASRKATPTPQHPIFGAPASATIGGPGNPAPPAPPAKPKRTVKIQPEQLAKVLKTCHKQSSNTKKRSTCEQQAQLRYRTKRTSTKKAQPSQEPTR